MARNHLRIQAGGHPSQGPVPEMANPTPGPGAAEDFPDHPDESPDARPSDKPDLDAFAAKLGIATSATDPAASDPDAANEPDDPSVGSKVASAASAGFDRVVASFASGLGGVATRLQRLSERLADR